MHADAPWRPTLCGAILSLTLGLLLSPGLAIAAPSAPPTAVGGWKAGAATGKLTPPGAIWLAGCASRATPSTGADLDANVRILNHPGRFTLDAEDRVIAKVNELHR
jgi:hypothetical protein